VTLRLRPLREDDEQAVRAAQRELAPDAFVFALFYDEQMPWRDYLDLLARQRAGDGELPAPMVQSSFLVAEVAGEIVGRVSIRHQLNQFLLHEGGHVGFGVRPAFRRRGYATEILRQALVVARAVGVERVLLTCDERNSGSAATIERCGGALENVVVGYDGARMRRYWID
jgi:predicted acetyltransferase